MNEEILEKLQNLLAMASEEQLNELNDALGKVQPELDTETSVKLRVGYALPSEDEPETYLSLFVRIG